jgi:adenylylsulfate kinase-like enzyme
MTQLTSLDASEITAWLTRVTQTIDRSLREPLRGATLHALRDGLDTTKVGLPILTQLALLDDCLRMAHLAIATDGKIEADELARVADLARVAAPKYFAALPRYEAFGDGAETADDVARFLETHRADTAAYGYAHAAAWRGLHLARSVEQSTRNAAPLREHERMLSRVMDEVFAGRSSEAERAARRKLRVLFEPAAPTSADPRAVAFCRDDGPEVFASVVHGSQIHERDPHDVESIHGEARDVFQSQIERATTPHQHASGQGRTLLILGESGAGKTHLLRALRSQVHAQRRGYVGYLQMASEVGDYTRYVLRNLIDSMERPYDAPVLSESALLYLSDGLAEGRVLIPADELEQLRTADIEGDALDSVVGRIIDRVVRTEGLETLEVDLLHALLLLQRRDAALQKRVVKYLRCEALGTHDRKLLGGLAARGQPEDPLRTIRQLATIMYELQMASLVLLVDQIEDTVPDGQTATRIQQAFDHLRAISDAVPSAVLVISCLTDVYDAIRPKLSRSLVDRLEHDPLPVRLSGVREVDEIEQMLIQRLDHLYSAFDVPWRDDEPLYPFTVDQVEAVKHLRARDCLAKFRDYHAACISQRTIVGATASAATAPAPPPAPEPPVVVDLDRRWNDALAAATELPDDDDLVLDLLAEALRETALEQKLALQIVRERVGVTVVGKHIGRRLIAICNKRPQGGALGKQLDAVRAAAPAGTIPVALRSTDWQFKPKSVIAQQVGSFLQAGGLTVQLEERDLRAMVASRALAQDNPPRLAEWRATKRPISSAAFARSVLELERVRTPELYSTQRLPHVVRPPAEAPAPPKPVSAQITTADPTVIRLGTTATMRAEPISISLDQIKAHAAFLGTTGSGKTTAALLVIEQLLERDVSVLLVDRKGDLARYASRAWWEVAAAPDAERRSALRARIDVALFTPGNAHGRSLRLPLIPALDESSAQDREQLAKFAAAGLASMMGYGTSATHRHKISVLQCAIQLHAGEREISIAVLGDTISRPDPELLQSVGSLQRFFAPLAEDLQSLEIQRGSLLAGEGEALDLAALLPASGRPQLSIIHTAALTEIPVLQFWVSRLLVELGRLAKRRPSATLQAAVFLDEADSYVPATSAPPTKQPTFELLRRARSGGIGVLLATQSPGDFDYKARDLIGTWLVGRVAQERAIDKMRNLLAGYPNVGPRLANQPTGHFFMLTPGQAIEMKCDRSMMQTEQISEAEIAELAKRSR